MEVLHARVGRRNGITNTINGATDVRKRSAQTGGSTDVSVSIIIVTSILL